MEKFDIVLKGRFVVSFAHGIIENGIVGVEGNRIKKIFRDGEIEYTADEIIGGDNFIVMPGLVNTHTHAAMIAFRGLADDLPLFDWLQNYIWPAEGKFVDREFIRKAVPVAIGEMISTGTTLFADMYFFQQDAAEMAKSIGMRAVLAEGIIAFPTPTAETWEKQLEYNEEFIKNWIGDELIKPSLGPHAPYTTTGEILAKVKEVSAKYGVPIQIHVAETRQEVQEVSEKFGRTPVRYLDSLDFLDSGVISAHSVWLDDEEIEIYVNKKVGIASCPQSNAKLASGVAPHKKYIEKGARLALGTDGDASNNSLDMFQEMKFMALVCKLNTLDPTACPALEVLKSATIRGAQVLGYEDLGDIKEGFLADLITLRINDPHSSPVYNPISHIVYAAKGTDVNDVIINGKIVYKNREFLTLDIENVGKQFEELVKKIQTEFKK